MKKLLLVCALGAFVACKNGDSKDAKTDSAANVTAPSADATKTTPTEPTEPTQPKMDSTSKMNPTNEPTMDSTSKMQNDDKMKDGKMEGKKMSKEKK